MSTRRLAQRILVSLVFPVGSLGAHAPVPAPVPTPARPTQAQPVKKQPAKKQPASKRPGPHRSAEARPVEIQPIEAPQVTDQRFTLPTGLHCILLESHERPMIRMDLVTRWDRSDLPPGKEALGGFLGLAMATAGAGSNGRAAFNRAVDGLGMGFHFQVQLGAYRWTVTADSRSQETAMGLLADAVARPLLDGPLVEGQRQLLVKQIGGSSPQERAISRFTWGLGVPDALLPPSVAALERVELQDLLNFRRRVVRPEASTLALYGDLNLAQAKQLVGMHLGTWGPGVQAPVQGIPPRGGGVPAPEPKLLAALGLGSGPELWAGAPRPAEGLDPGAEALLPGLLAESAPAIFGRLAMTFQLAPRGPLVIKAKVPQEQRDSLVDGFTAGLEALRRTGISPADLAAARGQWKAENVALPLHPERLLQALLDGRLEPALVRAVDAVTVQSMNQALGALLRPERLRYLFLGPDAPQVQAAEKAGLGPAVMAEEGH